MPTARSLYTLRGVHAKVTALWRFEAPPGAGDTHLRAGARHPRPPHIKQGAEQNYKPALYVENSSGAPAADFERRLRAAVAKLSATWPGLDVKPAGAAWEIVIPDKYRVGHEQHFAQVTEKLPALPGGGQNARLGSAQHDRQVLHHDRSLPPEPRF